MTGWIFMQIKFFLKKIQSLLLITAQKSISRANTNILENFKYMPSTT